MSKTIVAVFYVKDTEILNNCIMDWNALDDMLDKELELPVRHSTEIIGHIRRLSKKGDKIYATIELEKDIAFSLQQLGKESTKDKVIITDAKLFELYI
jgi:hypothetical protein